MPMKLIIDRLNINGEGVCNLNDKKYCTKGVLPKEEVLVDILWEKKNFCQCALNEVVTPSSARVVPICPYATSCGGCDMMHASYPQSIDIKKEIIANYFSQLYNGKIDVFCGKNTLNYRNKVSFRVKNAQIGLQRESSNDIVEISSCLVAKDEINKILIIFRQYVADIIKKYGKDSEEYRDVLSINHVVVRVLDRNVMITLVCDRSISRLDNFIELLKKEYEEYFGLYININKSSAKEILSDKWQYVCGRAYLEMQLEGYKFAIYPHSFMQVNNDVRDAMYDYVLDNVNGENVVEGYSGAGILSVYLSKKASYITAVEINKDAFRSANRAKTANNIENLENINGDFSTVFPSLCDKNSSITLVVDPPRSGLSAAVLDAIKENSPNKIIYISCSPYSLRQNIVYLNDLYKIDKLKIFDMFPQTSKIECVAILEKNKKLL